jgi:anthranilate synthase/aminodeoxychorismate synthase-like glutamine amidotransferase
MILVIDNYDSFVYNLARYVELAGCPCEVVRNDALDIAGIREKAPEAIILSPGPRTPKEAGICMEVVQELGADIPVLGVCLGHQAIAESYGASVVRSGDPVHGKASPITHNGKGLFRGLPSPLSVGRYHSLIVHLPEKSPLRVTAKTTDGTIMALQHVSHPVYGVQFHPESILTEHGLPLIQNFLKLAQARRKKAKETKEAA